MKNTKNTAENKLLKDASYNELKQTPNPFNLINPIWLSSKRF